MMIVAAGAIDSLDKSLEQVHKKNVELGLL